MVEVEICSNKVVVVTENVEVGICSSREVL